MFVRRLSKPTSHRARLSIGAIYLALVAALCAPAVADALRVEFEPCHIDHVEAQARCAYLPVPLDWSDENGPTIDLFVAIVPPSGGGATDAPLYLLAGGPGQAASDLGRLVDGALVPARKGREVIIVDQRGTGRTAPFNCTTPANADLAGDQVARDCLASIEQDPRHFGSDAFINDLHAVRNALGHEQIHLWGGSYGTRAALLYLARFGHTVRSVTLDAVAAPSTPFLSQALRTAGDSLERVIGACASDAACAAAFPDLRGEFAQSVEALAQDPRRLSIDGQALDIDAPAFLNTLRNAFYSRASTAWVPYVVHEFANGRSAPFAAMATTVGGIMDDVSLGAMLSVMCGEEVPRLNQLGSAESTTPFGELDLEFWHDACSVWPAATPPPELSAPVKSDVPTLLLSGALDPVTPPSYGELAAAHLGNARHAVAPYNAHITTSHGCAPRLIGEFLDTLDPQSLDVSCLSEIGEAPFLLGPAGPNP